MRIIIVQGEGYAEAETQRGAQSVEIAESGEITIYAGDAKIELERFEYEAIASQIRTKRAQLSHERR